MPFFRRKRFSATPRRSWSRRRRPMSGTLETRRQYAQANFDTGLVIHEAGLIDPANPSFLIQALTPWSNAPDGGYDRAWEIRGLIWSIHCYPTNHVNNGVQNGLYASVQPQDAFCRFGSTFFVDQVDPSGAPVSVIGPPLGPFATTPPIGSPTGAPSDDEFMPTRILKRKVSIIQTGALAQSATGSAAYAVGLSNFSWSGVLRKRVSIASRQGLYLGFYGLPPLGGYPGSSINDAGITIHVNLVYYYRLGR